MLKDRTIQRFLERIDRSGGEDACWPYTGDRYPKGYGHTTKSLGRGYAHRAAWELENGPIPAGGVLRHACDNPPCCNLRHLAVGTVQDNVDDRQRRGRHRVPHGEQSPKALLTDAIVLRLRAAHGVYGEVSRIAREVGVTPSTASMAARGASWKHVGDAACLTT